MAKDKKKADSKGKKSGTKASNGAVAAAAASKKGTERLEPLNASDLGYLGNLKLPKPPAHTSPADMYSHFTPGVRSFLERKAVQDFLGKRSGVEHVGHLAEQARRAEELKAKLAEASTLVTAVAGASSTGLYDIASSLNDARSDLAGEFGDDTEQLQALFDWWDEFHARTKSAKPVEPTK